MAKPKISTLPRMQNKTKKFHVNDKNEAAVCNAFKKSCPYSDHFSSLEKAREVAMERLEKEHGLLQIEKYGLSAKVYTDDFTPGEMTYHVAVERRRRLKILQVLGPGKLVSRFYCQEAERDDTIIEIRDNGLLIVYGADNGHKEVTRFAARPNRLKKYFTLADIEIPEELLETARNNVKNKYCSI